MLTLFPAPAQSRRRFVLGAGAAMLILQTPATQAASELPLIEAINQSGRQRMLSQRMAKFYAQRLRKVREAEAERKLAASMSLFASQLDALQRLSLTRSTPPLAATLGKLGEAWGAYAEVLKQAPTEAGLRQIAVLNENVLAQAQEATAQLEKLSGSNVGQLVNLAGRQRMLSQRVAKFYFFRQCGLDTPDFRQGLDKSRGDFVAALGKLRSAPENTKPIKDWIAVAEQQWMFFDDAVQSGNGTTEAERNVAITAENLLEVMDKLTGLYTQLG